MTTDHADYAVLALSLIRGIGRVKTPHRRGHPRTSGRARAVPDVRSLAKAAAATSAHRASRRGLDFAGSYSGGLSTHPPRGDGAKIAPNVASTSPRTERTGLRLR
jgi:hypothetical protein